MDKFLNRRHAGRVLAAMLEDYANKPEVIALALPRGGVPVAFEIAVKLSIPLDVFIVRKLGVPQHEELAMGAIASGGIVVLNESIVQSLNISKTMIEDVKKAEEDELKRREALYRTNQSYPTLEGKTIILVDDGIATGSTIRAAILALRQQNPLKIVIAVAVAAEDIYTELAELVDEIVCPIIAEKLYAVGFWYEDFSQTSDQEVCELLKKAN